MSIFNLFKRKNPAVVLTTESGVKETVNMATHRLEITKTFQDCLNKIDDVRLDKRMTPYEKYSVMVASLFMINKISGELMEEDGLFKDKQFVEILHQAKKLSKKDSSYIG